MYRRGRVIPKEKLGMLIMPSVAKYFPAIIPIVAVIECLRSRVIRAVAAQGTSGRDECIW